MFKKIYEKIDNLQKYMQNNFNRESDDHCNTRSMIRKESENIKTNLNRMERVITSQQRTIEQLTNALRDKYEHGLFIFSEDCKVPMVIRNGKEIINDMVSRFSIDWVVGEAPNIEIEQFVGTVSDMED